MTFLQGFQIATSNETHEAFTARIAGREGQINAEKNTLGRKNMEVVTEIRQNGFAGKIFVFGRTSNYIMEYEKRHVFENVAVEGYVHAEGSQTSFDFIAGAYDPDHVGNLAKLIGQLRLVGDDEIPNRAGFCFGRGIFLDPLTAEAREGTTLFAMLPSHPDLALAFSSSAGLKRTWPGLLERHAKSIAQEPFWVRAAFSILREGKRTINGLTGEELGVKVTEPNFTQGYTFDWEMAGTQNDVFAPQLTLELEAGKSLRPGGEPVQASLGQAAMLDLWDKISSSIRLRPRAPPKTTLAKPGASPIGKVGILLK